MTFVFGEGAGAENLRQLAAHVASQQVHLEQAIARRDIALREIEILIVLRFYIRNSALVPSHDNLVVQANDRDFVCWLLCRRRSRYKGCGKKKQTRADDDSELSHLICLTLVVMAT